MKKPLILLSALLAVPALATTPITGMVASKCIITTDTDGVYGNPTATKLSTLAASGGVLPIIRYDIITANAYKAKIHTPTSFSSSPQKMDLWPHHFHHLLGRADLGLGGEDSRGLWLPNLDQHPSLLRPFGREFR